ncbi:Bacterial membrane flanked domain protein [Micromonospora sp. MW-13]|uniref:PH domain-containing protein n=1 Tax=unclassified Micromonospora TaxID=2617518 RepID=UPI000E440FEB|nr:MULTISPECIES: PH domain-containing protein [unclassified Micromonospora]MCX4474511.1 PH domain-containing protein [Micromonospora sp. NBC_01655]RGC68098.1 Bacterial membrane flanked domain protein [Micromonospora sp. MW-13]
MGSPSGPPFDPDDPDRGRRERDTEPIPRVRPDDVSGPRPGPSDGPPFSDDVGYGDGPFAGEGRSGRAWVRDPEAGYQAPQISEEELAGLRVDASGMPLGPRRVLPLEDEPSSLVARYLFPTERYRGEWKRHWIHLTTPILVGIAATFVLGYLSGFLAGRDVGALTTVAVLLWFAVMGWVAWRVADWWYDRFILTNKRVMVVNGIITRKVAMMPLARVTDMKYEQSPTGRALNYGTFVLESAGQDQALREIKNLPNPNELYLRVVEEMYEPQAVEARLGKEADEAKADDGA